ncbi:hypothetical protein WMY93_014077 [Mugilogobius chulae]|uniref:Metallo-beta-lactamase domain-containing protein 1 n=1 Tax=Mugilogobius chulae TaxID=88201 RepID=A0AAW0P4D3_9GOBI
MEPREPVSLTECGGLDFPGEPLPQPDGTCRADGTITLLTGPRNILVDTGGPWDRDFLLRSLEERGLSAGDVHVVVGTHGHSDHVGNLSLFPGALLIVGYDVCRGDAYVDSPLARGQAYSVDEHGASVVQFLDMRQWSEQEGPGFSSQVTLGSKKDSPAKEILNLSGTFLVKKMSTFESLIRYLPTPVTCPRLRPRLIKKRSIMSTTDAEVTEKQPQNVSVIPSPGHSGQDVSVEVRGVCGGTLLVAGDLFENHCDESSWRELSLNPELQHQHRQRALQRAQVIIPGHGAPFTVSKEKQEAQGMS